VHGQRLSTTKPTSLQTRRTALSQHPTIVTAELYALSLAYAEPKTWTIGGEETESHYVVLKLTDDAGQCGAAEIVCKPTWNGMTQKLLMTGFEELAWPVLSHAALKDTAGGAALGRGFAGMTALQSLIDNAWRDVAAPPDAVVRATSVPGSKVLTRDTPVRMENEARRAIHEEGYRCLKIKIGQGIDTDRAVLAAIARVGGGTAMLTADANSAYSRQEIGALDELMQEHGVAFLEDPCPLIPDAASEEVIRACKTPVLVDRAASSRALAQAFVDRGATHFSVKPSRIGQTEGHAVMDLIYGIDGGVCFGTYAEAQAGALMQIGFCANYVSDEASNYAEIDFHRELLGDYLQEPIPFVDGEFRLPAHGNIADLIDWARLEQMAKGKIALKC
jgi:L-alanine-DL-glutamate epimerase-like enolase superfamily enzyme